MVNVYPLDLEYLQEIFDPLSDETKHVVEKTIGAQLSRLTLMSEDERRRTLVLGTIFWETIDLKTKAPFLELIERTVNNLGSQFQLITSLFYKNQLSDIPCNATAIDFFLLRTFAACQKQNINRAWGPEHKKILFLMGKYQKSHRLKLLYKLYKQHLLNDDKCVWSCIKLDIDSARPHLPRALSDSEIDDFLEMCYKLPDSADIIYQADGCTHYGGFPFDENLYKTTNISLISETKFYGKEVFITEKTYRAIANYHPFVIASTQGHNKTLQEMGFYTFDEFMTNPTYDNLPSGDLKLSAIVENVKNFNPSESDIKKITAMINHNADRLRDLAQEDSDKLQQILTSYNVDQRWEDIINLDDNQRFFLTWQFYYQTIKDPSWPHCETIEDCNKLPQDIQHELKTVFDLKF